MGKGSTIERCPRCGSWAIGYDCPRCGPFPRVGAAPATLSPAEQEAEAQAHRGALGAERTAYDARRRPSGKA